MPAIPTGLIGVIMARHREHRGLQRAVGDMTRRIKSEERWYARRRIVAAGGDLDPHKFPEVIDADREMVRQTRHRYYLAHDALEKLRLEVAKLQEEEVRQLPVAQFVAETKGFSWGSLAAIVGEAGDLSNYANPAKLWKRFCVHVIDGHAAHRVRGAGAEAQEFVPRRRAELHVIGENLLRAGGEYADLYRSRKATEVAKVTAAGLKIVPAAKMPDDPTGFISEGQIHRRALRYIEKRVLRNLWLSWHAANVADTTVTIDTMSPDARVSEATMPPVSPRYLLSPTTKPPAPEAVIQMSPTPPLPRRGRPTGSKNKPKTNGKHPPSRTSRPMVDI